MAVEKVFHAVHMCRSQYMYSFSHIPKHKTGTSLLTPYMDVGLIIMYMMNTASSTPNYIQADVVQHAPELQCKSMYDTRHGLMAIHFILCSVIGPTNWSVSCCRSAVLLLAVILLFYCRIHS